MTSDKLKSTTIIKDLIEAKGIKITAFSFESYDKKIKYQLSLEGVNQEKVDEIIDTLQEIPEVREVSWVK